VPSGALADSWSRKRLYALGEFLTAAGFALWVIWPSYPGFALGFVLWGVGGSLGSGALEALLYEELAAEGRSGDYARIAGRSGTIEILAVLAATLLAAPAWQTGGYLLVGAASVAVKMLGGLLALRLPENRADDGDEDGEAGYLASLRGGVREVVRSRPLARAVLIAALVPGFSALDEYLPLLAREMGAATEAVPLLYAVTALAMAGGSALAGRYAALGPRALPAALTAAAVLLAGGALMPHVAGMIAVSAAFGLMEFSTVVAETRLQDTITGRARSTVLSVAGFTSEVFAVGLYAYFVLPAALPVLFALCAVPMLLTALAARGRG
jgi:MFS family permease